MGIESQPRPHVSPCAPTDTLTTIAQRMCRHQVSALAVFDKERLVGVISHRDLVGAMADGADPKHAHAGQYSTRVLCTAAPAEDTRQVAQPDVAGARFQPVEDDDPAHTGDVAWWLEGRSKSISVQAYR
jgi:CBS-domain-containing membrane protein